MISLRVCSTSGCASEMTASAEAVRVRDLSISTVVLFVDDDRGADDDADLDNTRAVRDHFLSQYRRRIPASGELYNTHVGAKVSIFQ